jgi:hypothetical protein
MIYILAGIGLAVVAYLLIRGYANYRTNIIDLSDNDK